jgi:putative transposase
VGNTYTNLLYHIVFSTKDRVPAIHEDLRERLYAYVGGIIRGEGGALLEVGGMPDHVHLLTKLKSDMPVATMVRLAKSRSSKWVNEASGAKSSFRWQVGYGAFSVSESQVGKIRRYIQNQEIHHAQVPFKDELIGLLKKHRIEYDERYVFD